MNDRKTIPSHDARRRRIWFRLAAVMIGLLPLVLLEGVLRLFDVGRPADTPDPFAGFNRNFPLFEKQGAVYRTAHSRAPFIQPQEFPVEKPRGSFRLFCFGGSTVYGHPYLGATSFPQWLQLECAGSEPARTWQAINCGGISYASYRIVPMVKEVLRYQPDLIVVATGHNEFLEDRTYASLKSRSAFWAWLQTRAASLHLVTLVRAWIVHEPRGALSPAPVEDTTLGPTVHTRLDDASGYASYHPDAAWHERVIAQYDESVRTIVADCRAAHVPLILVRLGSNLRDCPPFKSEHRPGLAPQLETDWQAAFDLASAAEKADPARALEYYRAAAKIDGEYPLLDYRIARLLDRTGHAAEALPYYVKAKDEDVCPLRIISPVEDRLVRIATETNTPLVDAAKIIAAKCPDQIPGDDWYVDHVHPSIGGHQLIAHALAAQMREHGWLARNLAWDENQRRAAYERHFASLGSAYFADGKRRVGWLDRWSQRQRLATEAEPNDARGYVRLGFRQFDLGDNDAAAQALHEALRRDSGVASLIEERVRDLVAQGRADRGAALLAIFRAKP